MAPKYLLLVDLNGTLCYRSEAPVRGVRADFEVRRKYLYKREGVENFIQKLVDSGLYRVAVYSSVMKHNLLEYLQTLVPLYSSLGVDVLDREMNKPDPNGVNEWDTVRDMEKVWKALPNFGPTNTILLDNEARKFIDTPSNGIVVPEYGEDEVRVKAKATLAPLLEYLQRLAERSPVDVRLYLQRSPFGEPEADQETDHDADEFSANLASLSLSKNKEHSASCASAPEEPTVHSVPKGVQLQLVCIEDGKFLMSNAIHDVRVWGAAAGKISRIDARMDFHLLVDTAARCGEPLEIDFKGKSLKV